MAMIGDTTLQARPELFELVATGRTVRIFRLMAGMTSVMMIGLSILGFTVLDEPIVGIAGAVLAVSSPATMLWLSTRMREWRLRDGRELRTSSWGLTSDPEETWQHLASGDPSRYAPLKVGSAENAPVTLRSFWPADERVTYVVIVRGSGQHGDPSQIIELRDSQHDAFQAAQDRRFRAA